MVPFSDSMEFPRDLVPGTARKFEWLSLLNFDVGEETLCGEVGLLSRYHSEDVVERASVGEIPDCTVVSELSRDSDGVPAGPVWRVGDVV